VLSRDKSGTLARLETDAESQEGISALADLHQRNPRLAATATQFLPSRTPPYFLSIFNLESIPRKSVLFNNRIGMVETFKGIVQLSGFVNSRADINKAVAVARGVGGVKSVKNDMRLK
jgi:hypothetical protein